MTHKDNPWLKGLNSEQQDAALHNEGPLLILAGAGSGKTTVLVSRSGRLVAEGKVKASELCVLTFTNKAAKELKKRVSHRLGSLSKGLWAGTFHSFGLEVLRKYYSHFQLPKDFGVINPSDVTAILKEELKNISIFGKKSFDTDLLYQKMNDLREKSLPENDEYSEAAKIILPKYEQRLINLGVVDFEGLILKPTEAMDQSELIANEIQSRFQFVMVDEFQDTNSMQMRLISKLVEKHRNLAVVGDDDQSIYGWRGAKIENILEFPRFFQPCKIIKLEKNYRSSKAILSVANHIIQKNTQRHHKQLVATQSSDENQKPRSTQYETETEEAEIITHQIIQEIENGISKKEIAVLYRANSQVNLIEAELRKNNIPYSVTGGIGFFDRKETRDVLAFIRCAFKPNELALRRTINLPSRGIGDKTIEKIFHYTQEKQTSFLNTLRNWKQVGLEHKIGAEIEIYLNQLNQLQHSILEEKEKTVGNVITHFLNQIGYREHLDKMAANLLVAANRWRFVETLCEILDRYIEVGGRNLTSLNDFIDSMELRDIASNKDEKIDKVQLMTLHACKGLEFHTVFLIGLEEDILPHKILGSDISEERRLFYVGVTRAKQNLFLSRNLKRKRNGKLIQTVASRFLLEIPHDFLNHSQENLFSENSQAKRRAMLDALYQKLEEPKITSVVSIQADK